MKLPWWLFILLIPLVTLAAPDRKLGEELRKIERNGNEIIIVSARPRQFSFLTKMWLRSHKIPFNRLYCIGLGKGTKQRKLEIILREEIGVFFDDDVRVIQFLNGKSINAIRVRGRQILPKESPLFFFTNLMKFANFNLKKGS